MDSITTWLAAAMDDCGAWDGTPGPAGLLAGRIAGLVAAWRGAAAYVVAVSDETGLGIVPETTAGRMFRDELGRLNQLLAAESDEVIMVVAGPQRAPERLSRGLPLDRGAPYAAITIQASPRQHGWHVMGEDSYL